MAADQVPLRISGKISDLLLTMNALSELSLLFSNIHEHFVCWVKISADDILKYFSNCFLKIGSSISCRFSPKETICMKGQTLFFGQQ